MVENAVKSTKVQSAGREPIESFDDFKTFMEEL